MKLYIQNLIVIFLYAALSYPLFYYAYKFGSPDFGNNDFYSYYHLYNNWDFKQVESPFNTRLISSFFIYLFNKIGFFYNAEINYHHPMIDQRVFFNALFFNYLSLVITAFIIYKTICKFFVNKFFAFFSGTMTFLGFGALFYSLNTLTESFSILLFTLIFFAYQSRSYWIAPLLLLAVIQREYIFFIMGLVSIVHYFFYKSEKKYFFSVFIFSVLGFGIYYILRKTVFFTPYFSSQLDFPNLFARILHPGFPIGEYIRQSFLNQNILLLYIFIILYKLVKKSAIDKLNLAIVLLLYLQAHFVSILAVLGNSCGRYFYITLPLLIFFIAKEIRPLLSSYLKFDSAQHV